VINLKRLNKRFNVLPNKSIKEKIEMYPDVTVKVKHLVSMYRI